MTMSTLERQAGAFRRIKERRVREARQCAALFLISGIELADALKTQGPERRQLLTRLARMIERERQKGTRRHWSYDLNRHIALKQAFDRLNGQDADTARPEGAHRPTGAMPKHRRRKSLQRQRRRPDNAPPPGNRLSR